jgi:hypothetical protein
VLDNRIVEIGFGARRQSHDVVKDQAADCIGSQIKKQRDSHCAENRHGFDQLPDWLQTFRHPAVDVRELSCQIVL